MSAENWSDPVARCVGARFYAAGFEEVGPRGEPITDADFLLLLNAYHESIEFRLPESTGLARAHRHGAATWTPGMLRTSRASAT